MTDLNPAVSLDTTAPRGEEEVESADEGFAFVRISELFSPRKIAFDLFLRLGTGKYLKIFRAGENFDEAALKAYEADRGMRYVYFERKQRLSYVASSLSLFNKISPIPAIPLPTKFGVARIMSELWIQAFLDSEDAERSSLMPQGVEICAALAGWIDTSQGLERHLLFLEQIDAHSAEHCFLTGVFSCLLANRMPWKSRRTIETLLLACFVSELGLTAMPDLKGLKQKRMNPQQKRQYEKHPEASFLLLSEISSQSLNENVLTIVRQHHEYADGTGYPKGLTSDKTLMLAKVVVLCGDLIRTASEFLLPPNEAAKVLFPEFTEKLMKEHPDLVAKYERELLPVLFKLLMKEGAA